MNEIPATTFNAWTLLFSGFAFIGLFYAIKLLGTRGGDKMDLILGIYLLLQSIMLLEYVLFWTNLIFSVPALTEVSLLFPLLYGPLLLIYFDRSFGNDKPLKKYFVHFIPFCVLLTIKIPFYLSSAEFKLYHVLNIPFGAFFHYYYPWVAIWHMTLYCVVLYSLINNQSGVGFMRSWARWVVVFFSLYIAFSFFYRILVQTNLLTPKVDYFVSLAPCVTIFFIAWYGKGFKAVADGMGILDSLKAVTSQSNTKFRSEMLIESGKSSGNEKYRNSGLPKTLEIKLSQDLEKLMEEQQLYKQNDLKLETLAEKLNTSKHFVSQVINEIHKVNFFEYVNLKRIEEAKQLLRLKSKKDLNIIEIAYEVGFNNKGTFNAVFKKITGLTPTEFRRQSNQLLESRPN